MSLLERSLEWVNVEGAMGEQKEQGRWRSQSSFCESPETSAFAFPSQNIIKIVLQLLICHRSSFVYRANARSITFKYLPAIGHRTLFAQLRNFTHSTMCFVMRYKYLCKNEWCGNWGNSAMILPSTWIACDLPNNPDNYSSKCPKFRPHTIQRMEHSNHYYCVICKANGFVDD